MRNKKKKSSHIVVYLFMSDYFIVTLIRAEVTILRPSIYCFNGFIYLSIRYKTPSLFVLFARFFSVNTRVGQIVNLIQDTIF